MPSLTREKLDQARKLVADAGVDVWMVFVRETSGGSDPCLPLILDAGLTWQSALMVTRTGETIAVLGNYDADPLRVSGDWDRIVPYVQGIREPLLEVLDGVCGDHPRIAVNTSTSDDKADGITHGMYRLLETYLSGTRLEEALVSAEGIAMALRGRKSAEEVRRMRRAIAETDALFDLAAAHARVGASERAIYRLIQERIDAQGFGYGWERAGNPIVNSGPDSMIGHGIPSDTITIQPGHIFHIDLGVVVEGYSSDIQRCWFVGDSVPDDVSGAFDAVQAAISAGASMLRPGIAGWEVDAEGRRTLVDRGYPEYMHALGHQVGRMAHDGGALLGPRWERYGRTPLIPVSVDEVYTLELGITVPGRGYLGYEEMVQVTPEGCTFLSNRPTSMPLLG
ncbi:MAG TPA: M24 family metallopeptidase [Fimbriimonadaceae bacterium]|nr:M24 family metallopeptidase [Fimbriimonadaceae bacterium]